MVVTTPNLTVHLVSVILMESTLAVMMSSGDSVATPNIMIVLVTPVQTTGYSKTGMNQMAHRSGDTTGSVVDTTPYLTVHLVSVILTGKNRVVAIIRMDIVVTVHSIVLVKIVWTSKTGRNQMVHKNGDTTEDVVVTIYYLTIHLVSVILMGISHAAIMHIKCVVTVQSIVLVRTV